MLIESELNDDLIKNAMANLVHNAHDDGGRPAWLLMKIHDVYETFTFHRFQ